MTTTDTPIVNPQKFIAYLKETGRLKHEKAPETVIFIFLNSLLEACKERYELNHIEGFDAGSFFQLEEDGHVIGLFCCAGIGAPVAVINMEELIAFGVKNFLVVGTAGSLQKDLQVGDIMLCSQAIVDEGTSKHYITDQKTATPNFLWNKQLRDYSLQNNLTFKEGASWTTDAPYRETQEKIINFQQQGILAVEMEISALFTLADFYKVNIAAMFTISDSLANLSWSPGFFSEKVTESLLKLIDNATNFAKTLTPE